MIKLVMAQNKIYVFGFPWVIFLLLNSSLGAALSGAAEVHIVAQPPAPPPPLPHAYAVHCMRSWDSLPFPAAIAQAEGLAATLAAVRPAFFAV